jgi:hypothetical protein
MMEQVDYSKLVFKHIAAITCTPTVHREAYTRLQRPLLQVHQRRTQLSWLCRDGHSGSTSTLSCAATTRHPGAWALRQPRRASRVLVSRPQRLYIDYIVRRRDVVFWAYDYFDYSSRLVNLSRAATMSSTTSRIHLRLVDFGSNRRGSITDRHGFVDTRSRIKLSHLFQ